MQQNFGSVFLFVLFMYPSHFYLFSSPTNKNNSLSNPCTNINNKTAFVKVLGEREREEERKREEERNRERERDGEAEEARTIITFDRLCPII